MPRLEVIQILLAAFKLIDEKEAELKPLKVAHSGKPGSKNKRKRSMPKPPPALNSPALRKRKRSSIGNGIGDIPAVAIRKPVGSYDSYLPAGIRSCFCGVPALADSEYCFAHKEE